MDLILRPDRVNHVARQGENLYTRALIDIEEFQEEYPLALYSLLYLPKGTDRSEYAAIPITIEGHYVVWDITHDITAQDGPALVQVKVVCGRAVFKGEMYTIHIDKALHVNMDNE